MPRQAEGRVRLRRGLPEVDAAPSGSVWTAVGTQIRCQESQRKRERLWTRTGWQSVRFACCALTRR